jgi:choice-of-anchor A domain-containing protein
VDLDVLLPSGNCQRCQALTSVTDRNKFCNDMDSSALFQELDITTTSCLATTGASSTIDFCIQNNMCKNSCDWCQSRALVFFEQKFIDQLPSRQERAVEFCKKAHRLGGSVTTSQCETHAATYALTNTGEFCSALLSTTCPAYTQPVSTTSNDVLDCSPFELGWQYSTQEEFEKDSGSKLFFQSGKSYFCACATLDGEEYGVDPATGTCVKKTAGSNAGKDSLLEEELKSFSTSSTGSSVCPDDWYYVLDSNTDGYDSLMVGKGSVHEYFGIAYRQTGDKLQVLFIISHNKFGDPKGDINVTMPGSGVQVNMEVTINMGDLFVNIKKGDGTYENFMNASDAGSLMGVRHDNRNDAGVSDLGVYSNVVAMDVTYMNSGFKSVSAYDEEVEDRNGTAFYGPRFSSVDDFVAYYGETPYNDIETGTLVDSSIKVNRKDSSGGLENVFFPDLGVNMSEFTNLYPVEDHTLYSRLITMPRSAFPDEAFDMLLSQSQECFNDHLTWEWEVCQIPSPSPSETPSRTASPSMTRTASSTQSPSITRTPTASTSVSRTPTSSISVSSTPSVSVTAEPSVSLSPSTTPSASKTAAPSLTSDPSDSRTPSPSRSPSKTRGPSFPPQINCTCLHYKEQTFNTLILNDFNASSDTQGRLIVCGDANIASYSVADQLVQSNGTQDYLIVDGVLTFASGHVSGGNIVFGDGAYIGDNVWHSMNNSENSIRQEAGAFPCTDAQIHYEALSSSLCAATPKGDVIGPDDAGTLTLDSNREEISVWDVDCDVLEGLNTILTDGISDGQTAVINFRGQKCVFDRIDWKVHDRLKTVVNFCDATEIHFSAMAIEASILAPLATIESDAGSLNGQVVAFNWNGGMQQNHFICDGCLDTLEPAEIEVRSTKKKTHRDEPLGALNP